MTTLLLIVIYVSFIGLGLPDSLFGSAWPAIYSDLGLPKDYANFVTIIISIGTALSSFFSARLINKFGTKTITLLSSAIIALSLLGFSLSNNILALCVCSIPAGLGAGAIDAGLNNYIALNYSATHMNFLHCFYGVGVALSPYLLSLALSFSNDWRLGYRIVFYIQLGITLLSLISLPLWKKVNAKNNIIEKKGKTLSFKQLCKTPGVVIGWVVYFTTTALEFTCGTWSCTYLVETVRISEAQAARIFLFFYVGMTVGRFLSGVVSNKLCYKQILAIGYGTVGLGILILFLPLPVQFKGVALFLIGLGNGPTYPNLTYQTPKFFGEEASMSMVGAQMLMATLGILIMPPIFGFLAENISFNIFPLYILIMFVIMVVSTIIFIKKVQSEKNK